jgi:hypothetical protein
MATNNNCPFDITPYTQSDVIVTPNIFNLNYTNQDFWSMKSRLVEFIQQKFPNDFSDFVESSIAIMLIENWAFLADTLSFKMDQIANEIFIDTVTELENAFRLAQLVGYQPLPPIAARAMFTASLNNPLLSDAVIPTPYRINFTVSGAPISFELFPANADNEPMLYEDILIPAGAVTNSSIIGLEGRTVFTETSGTGTVGQVVTLDTNPVIYDSVRVYVDGVQWEKVDFFTDSNPRREFRLEFDSTWTAFVIFGNNTAGLIPTNGSVIRVVYRTGGGTVGNIVSGAVEAQTVTRITNVPYPVPVAFRNYTRGDFGFDGDTINDIRQKLPAWTRAQNRAVTALDYKTLTDQFATPYQGQIGKSTAVLRNYGCAGNIIDLYILARDGVNGLKEANADLQNSLNRYLNTVQMFTDFVCLRDGQIIFVDISIDIVSDRLYRKFEEELRIKVQRRIDAFFAISNWEYGESLKEIDITQTLSDLREFTSIDVTFVTNDPNNGGSLVTTKFYEIIRPDTVTVNFTYN